MKRDRIHKVLGILGAALAAFGNSACRDSAWAPKAKSSEDLEEIVAKNLVKTGQPSAAVALVRSSGSLVAASGRTRAGGARDSSRASLYQIGSVTKSMTALLVEILVERGALSYESRLGELLPDIGMRDEYRDATVLDLILSRAGILPFQLTEREDPGVVDELWHKMPLKFPEDPLAQRAAMTAFVLSLPPYLATGQLSPSPVYSNAGWAILGHIVERKAAMSYEAALGTMIFEPLGIGNFKIGGWPRDDYSDEEPVGHYPASGIGSPARAQSASDSYILPAWMNPSGGVNLDIEGFAAYAEEHLLGLKGRGKLLPRAGYERLHTVAVSVDSGLMYQELPSGTMINLGMGWGVEKTDMGSLSYADGSAGTYFARIGVFPPLDIAFAGLTNSGDGNKVLSGIIEDATGFRIE